MAGDRRHAAGGRRPAQPGRSQLPVIPTRQLDAPQKGYQKACFSTDTPDRVRNLGRLTGRRLSFG